MVAGLGPSACLAFRALVCFGPLACCLRACLFSLALVPLPAAAPSALSLVAFVSLRVGLLPLPSCARQVHELSLQALGAGPGGMRGLPGLVCPSAGRARACRLQAWVRCLGRVPVLGCWASFCRLGFALGSLSLSLAWGSVGFGAAVAGCRPSVLCGAWTGRWLLPACSARLCCVVDCLFVPAL